MAYLELIKIDLTIAAERTPVFGSQLNQFYNLAESIQSETAVTGSEGILGSMDNFKKNGADTLGNIVGELSSPDLQTLQSVNIQVNIAEKVMRMLKVDLGTINNMGGMLEWMIRPIFVNLTEVRDEMKAFLEREDGLASLSGGSGAGIMADIGTSTNRLRWSTKLE